MGVDGLASVVVDISKHSGMHKTRSLDSVMVLSGKLSPVLDAEEVELHKMDVVIQQDGNHARVNREEVPATILVGMYGFG